MRLTRPLLAALAAACVSLAAAPAALAQGGAGLSTGPTSHPAPSSPTAGAALKRALNAGMRQAGVYSGAEVADLSAGQALYDHNENVPRLPASVNKLYTTTTALQMFGPGAHLSTTVLGTGHRSGVTWVGTLYLRGGGDPTFGGAAFDHRSYGTGATVQQLAWRLRRSGIRRLRGGIVADASWFDSDRGTPATRNRPSLDVEGALSGLDFNRGWADARGEIYDSKPARVAGRKLAAALRADGVAVPRNVRVRTGRTPATATRLASAASPTMAKLVSLTNTPSDNFFAETLVKDIGRRFGATGSTAAGTGVVRSHIASQFHIHPYMNDGSGLSRADRTTPAQVVTLLGAQADDTSFTNSLAIVGRTGTLVHEMRGSIAQDRCRGKTGTLHDVSNVVGYCTAPDGHTLAYAIMMNGVNPDAAHPIQNRMVEAIARYDG